MLLVNATDLDASREFGQASLIYSLEGSSQFRLNSRSGMWERVCVHLLEQMCAYAEATPVIETFSFLDLIILH